MSVVQVNSVRVRDNFLVGLWQAEVCIAACGTAWRATAVGSVTLAHRQRVHRHITACPQLDCHSCCMSGTHTAPGHPQHYLAPSFAETVPHQVLLACELSLCRTWCSLLRRRQLPRCFRHSSWPGVLAVPLPAPLSPAFTAMQHHWSPLAPTAPLSLTLFAKVAHCDLKSQG